MGDLFKYDPDIPSECLQAIKPHLKKWAWLLPGWCQFVRVSWQDADGDGAAIATVCNSEYRWAHMTFYAQWLEADDALRQVDVIHDLLHVSTNPINDHARNTIQALMGDSDEAKKYFAIEEERLRELHEGMVQDIANAIQKRLAGAS